MTYEKAEKVLKGIENEINGIKTRFCMESVHPVNYAKMWTNELKPLLELKSYLEKEIMMIKKIARKDNVSPEQAN